MKVGIFCPSALTIAGGKESFVVDVIDALSTKFRISLYCGRSAAADVGISSPIAHAQIVEIPFSPRTGRLGRVLTALGPAAPLRNYDLEPLSGSLRDRELEGALAECDVLQVEDLLSGLLFHKARGEVRKLMSLHGPDIYPLGRILSRPILRSVDCLFVLSEHTQQHLPAHIRARVAAVVPHGIDIEAFRPKPGGREKTNGGIAVGYVGRIDRGKGLGKLFELVQLEESIELHVAGIPEDGYGRRLVRMMKHHPRVRLWGRLSRRRLPSFYNSLDLTLIPSESESFGRVAMESLACGIPVIAPLREGLLEAFGPSRAVLGVRSNDPRAFRSAITEIVHDPERLDAMGRLGREYVVRNFPLSRTSSEIAKLWLTQQEPHTAAERAPGPTRR